MSHARRYARREDNILAASCQLTLVFCFIGGCFIRLFGAISELASPQDAAFVIAFTSTTMIALPIAVVTLAMVVVMFVVMLVLIRKEGHLPILLLAETGVPPVLTVMEGQKWHLFLSHVWSTGQECAAKQLQLCPWHQFFPNPTHPDPNVHLPTIAASPVAVRTRQSRGSCSGCCWASPSSWVRASIQP